MVLPQKINVICDYNYNRNSTIKVGVLLISTIKAGIKNPTTLLK